MKIGSQHVYKIWRSLVEYRSCVEVPVPPATSDCLCTLVPVCATDASAPAAVVTLTGRDPDRHPAATVLASTAGGDVRLCDPRPPGRSKIILKDDHNYC